MQINRLKRYENNLFQILDYIAQDKFSASEKFKNELDALIDDISAFPYKCKKSIYFDNDNIRDMVFKGYTIIYRVNMDKNSIDVIGIFNRNKPPQKQHTY